MTEDMKELNSPEFSNALLHSVFKLFFARAPEMKSILGMVF